MSKFNIVDETNKSREAFLIANIEHEEEKYSIYAIKRDEKSINIFVSKLILSNNSALLVDIYDNNKKKKIDDLVKLIIKIKSIHELKENNIKIINDVDFNDSEYSFTTYKAYCFSIKNDLFDKVIDIYCKNKEIDKIENEEKKENNENIVDDINKEEFENSDEDNKDYITLSEANVKFEPNLPQKINEEKETLFELNDEQANELEKTISKITFEKLDINDTDDLVNLFEKEKVSTADNSKKGYISDIVLVAIGMFAFILTIIFLIFNF